MRNVPGLETIERDYSSKGVKFYYIYKALAHPENNGYVAPFTLAERLMHVAEAKKQFGTQFHWICDSMDNDLKHALGDRPNSEFVIDPEGKIVVARQWSNPKELRADLEEFVGTVRQPTTIADIGMKPIAPPKTAPKGVVPRIKLPGQLSPVVVEPIVENDDDPQPFYAKLRAEVDSEFSRNGEGKLYLGFFLDPLYKVHWNNRAAPVTFEITDQRGVVLSEQSGRAPEVKEDADADPREFLIDLSEDPDNPQPRGSREITLTVKYFACDDAETFCKPVSQSYRVSLNRDRDGGSRRSAGGRGGPRRGSQAGNRSRSRSQMTPQQRRAMQERLRRQGRLPQR